MKCLINNLSILEGTNPVWFVQGIDPIKANELAWVLTNLDPEPWKGKRVALGKISPLELAFTLIFLDGLAEAILFLPIEEDSEQRLKRLSDYNIDRIIEGDGLDISRLINASRKEPLREENFHSALRENPLNTIWLLPTSGTTGTPKFISHSMSSLTRSMRLGKKDNYLWGSLYSLRRFAGLQVFLQSWFSGTPFVLPEESTNLSDTLSYLAMIGCNALSGTPSMWRKLSMHPSFDFLNLKQITLGGEIVDQTVLDMLAKRFPSARIVHIYASTEAGVGFVVRDGKAGFPAEYIENPPARLSMRVDQNGHLLFYQTPSGQIFDTPEINWIDSGDVVKRLGNRYYFLGRANGSINVGGNKVMPEEVESVIRELTEILFVQVRAKKSTVLGNLVEAIVVPANHIFFDSELKKKIIAHCRSRLEDFKVPALISVATDFTLSSSGKLLR